MTRILIKIFKQRGFADNLLKLGQVYFNTSVEYNQSTNKEQGDENEGADWIDNTPISNIKVDHPTLGIFEFKPDINFPSKAIQYNNKYLSYSLIALTSDLFNNDGTYKLSHKLKEFGDTAVVIMNPNKFLNSLARELQSKNIWYEMRPVVYQDLKSGRIDLTPFDKKIEHQHQCEFRIIIDNVDDKSKLINIGSIEGYSEIRTSDFLIEGVWEAKR